MKNLENGTEFIWPKEKFLNRLYLMKEMYNNYEEEEEDWDLPEDKDPFQEDVNTEVSSEESIKLHISSSFNNQMGFFFLPLIWKRMLTITILWI